ncbi:hypothetical protein DICA4_D01442 [Diutina catenulata]
MIRRSFSTMRGSGRQGVDGRTPRIATHHNTSNTGLAITDPFVLYQNYVASGAIEKDEAQLRTMKEFQKLYHRLVDYRPRSDVENKINLMLRDLEHQRVRAPKPSERSKSILERIGWRPDPEKQSQQLIKFVTDEELLLDEGYSPQGLLVNGDVGCGKSMLMDIFAASLPHESKMRWHFNNFMLWVYTQMHEVQQARWLEHQMVGNRMPTLENEFLLFHVARKMIRQNTVLILDEFMLPDIASAHIIKILFTYYFKLGGVLVATSNKLPEELYSANFHKTKFSGFVQVLHARCQSVDMIEGVTDYRAKADKESNQSRLVVGDEMRWEELVAPVMQGKPEPVVLEVYSRKVTAPCCYNDNTVAYLEFSEICQGLYAASDYITLASRFPIVVVDKVPVMTLKMKNEARRFITLIDALYEARCQVYMHTAASLDHLFFPKQEEEADGYEDVQEQEMFARTQIDTEIPYRPNVSTYDQTHTETYPTEVATKSKRPLSDNFTDAKAFTGEDEMFAYRRAVSRIKEMVSDRWAKTSSWVPVDDTMRPWEKDTTETSGERRNSPSTTDLRVERAPKFKEDHIWQMGRWTKTNADRAKDPITKSWLKSGVRNRE